jgi:PBP1b-binding outer membrane lipoprotein LpoB
MKKKYSFIIIICIFMINGCSSVKDGLTLKKKTNSQQFLIEKKKPLVMPPDYEKLPEPGSIFAEGENEKKVKNNMIELEKIFSSNSEIKNNDEKNEISDELEKKILKELE